MHRGLPFTKQATVLAAAMLSLAIFASPANAADPIPTPTADETSAPAASSPSATGGALQEIATATKGTLKKVNSLPKYLDAMLKLAVSWLTPDTSESTAKMQSEFSAYASQSQKGLLVEPSLQNKFTDLIFGGALDKLKEGGLINDLTYTSVLGQPYLSPDPRNSTSNSVDSSLKYIENAAGANITHAFPEFSGPNTADRTAYKNYYNAITSVQSYNAYLLSKVYTENSGGAKVSQTQASLVKEASSPSWFQQIASEEIGVVLRQILMYNSQMYVLLSQLVETQKQMVTAQAMNNTLLILLSQYSESLMIRKAVTGTGQ